MRQRLALALAALLGAAGLARGAAAQALGAADLRTEVSGNTLSGYNTSGVIFSEYHAPDGRVFGHNNGEAVVEGCWDIKADAVCYYYARSRHAGTFCWRFERAGPAGFRIRSTESAVTGVVRLDPGNPKQHSDAGKPWVCEGLVAHGPRRPGPVLAAGPGRR